MVIVIKELCKNGKGEITFSYDKNNENDIEIIKRFGELCKAQNRCNNCSNFYYDGCLGNYQACCCKIHGSLETWDNPHHDMDGSKCVDYNRK